MVRVMGTHFLNAAAKG